MAREFAKPFYNSTNWLNTRDYIFKKYHGLCCECGEAGEEVHHIQWLTPKNISDPYVTLSEDNLVLLCRDCHFKEHREDKKQYKISTNDGTYFDEEGNLCNTKVFIVHGAPASGKSTYVKDNMTTGDLVIDLDLIKDSISLRGKTTETDNLLGISLNIREHLYDIVSKREVNAKTIWIISSLPTRKEREDLVFRLDAELIHINSTIQECLSRIKLDNDRPDKRLQRQIINKYFLRYEP